VDSEISLKMNWPAPKFVLALRLNLLLNNTFKTCGALAVTTEISHFFYQLWVANIQAPFVLTARW
jgi:hypothetical protein